MAAASDGEDGKIAHVLAGCLRNCLKKSICFCVVVRFMVDDQTNEHHIISFYEAQARSSWTRSNFPIAYIHLLIQKPPKVSHFFVKR